MSNVRSFVDAWQARHPGQTPYRGPDPLRAESCGVGAVDGAVCFQFRDGSGRVFVELAWDAEEAERVAAVIARAARVAAKQARGGL